MADIIVRYLHFIGIIFLSATLIFEYFLLKENMSNENFKRVCRIDAIYGLSALIVLIAGSLLWFVVGKEASFYTSNLLFHIKLTLFLLIGILSISPTIYFIKNRNTQESIISVPRKIITFVKIEVLLLLLIPLLATLVANGYGL